MRFKLMSSCLSDRRFYQLSHGASQWGVKSYVTIAPPPPPTSMHSWIPTLYIHTIPAPTPWIPSHTIQLQGDLSTPLTHNNTQQHTTTHHNTQQHTATPHNSTRVHKTTNVPVVFMARYVMMLRGATSLLGALEGVGPKKSRFSGPTPSNAPCNDVAPLKIITYRTIKTTGTLIVNIQLYFRSNLYAKWGIQQYKKVLIQNSGCKIPGRELKMSCARIYRPKFSWNKPKTLVFHCWKRALWACFHENRVYKFGHWMQKVLDC